MLNIFCCLTIWYDKRKAQKGRWRTPENRFFILAVLGGSTGIYFGMKVFRHKTLHHTFKYGIPILIILNTVTIG
ncbi:MAG: DUF1294 domain-containing protein [Clostridia bacterium]|nr:DUF1294 domain-containing protein [Clostridia bacterium]